ncbi:MAG: heavy-metal-associated domain-containing protein [Candidatus Accumulibacter sp.]|jgi:copper chaperone|nr:heavy-metal-associated domain-containing protein [Accumulibacter sp.]MDR1276566.1 heavy-metal-associated domain-containing protein [Accumulibacter sp.]
MEKTIIHIEGMSCQGCVKSVTNVLRVLPGVEHVSVSLEKKQAEIAFDPVRVGVAQFKGAVEEAGFDVI